MRAVEDALSAVVNDKKQLPEEILKFICHQEGWVDQINVTNWFTDPDAIWQYTESVMINGCVVEIRSLGADSYFWMCMVEGLKKWPSTITKRRKFSIMRDELDFHELAREVFAGHEILDDDGHVKHDAKQTDEVYKILCSWDKYEEMFSELSEEDQARVAIWYDPNSYDPHDYDDKFMDMFHYAMVEKLLKQFGSFHAETNRFDKKWFDALSRPATQVACQPVFKFVFKHFKDAKDAVAEEDASEEDESEEEDELVEILELVEMATEALVDKRAKATEAAEKSAKALEVNV